MPEITQPTPEELAEARKAREDAINARIAGLKANEGKWFVRKDGKSLPILVKKYAGLFQSADGRMVYTFSVEIPGHAAWNPGATDFLEEHVLLDPQPAAATETPELPH